MSPFSKRLFATLATGAMAMGLSAPASAHHKHRDKIDGKDVIAGALIIGGIAALASAASKDRHYRGDRYHHHYRKGNPRRAVGKCVHAAERQARYSGYRFADVTEIRSVRDTGYGWQVKGRLVVDGLRSYRASYRGGHRHHNYHEPYRSAYDRGKFTCHIERGRVADVNYRGIRGL